jgi:hypothetical protein
MLGLMERVGRTQARKEDRERAKVKRMMTRAMRQIVKVKPGGVIEVRAPELTAGTVAEIIVLTETPGFRNTADRAQELATLLRDTQAVPQARTVSEEEIAAEIAAYRAGRT